MRTAEIVKEINRLPVAVRLQIIEQTLKSIRETEIKNDLEEAARTLYNYYASDKELTAFTSLDLEDFYETK